MIGCETTEGFNMRGRLLLLAVVFGVSVKSAEPPIPQPQLASKGAFAFPQSEATVVCDYRDLRVSIWNNSEYLFVQAVLWKDGSDALGKTEDNREIGDTSTLMLDVDGDG